MSGGNTRVALSASTSASTSGTGAIQNEKLASYSRRAFALGEPEATRLAHALPLELAMIGVAELEKERMRRTLASLGVDVAFSPMQVAHAPCARHSKLAASELCPRCKEQRTCHACIALTAEKSCAKCAKKIGFSTRFRHVRIAVLLSILVVIAASTWLEKRRITSWNRPLSVAVYPVAGDAGKNVADYVGSVSDASFRGLAPFFEREGGRYGIAARPVIAVRAGPVVPELPPPPPALQDRSPISVGLWSLHLRWWTFWAARKYGLGDADVRMFAIYHTPAPGQLEHSLGLERVRVSVAHLYASSEDEPGNDVVLAHELLHVVGASDEYDESGHPIFPDGYAEPERTPRHPQVVAEIMSGRVPMSEGESRAPESLERCAVGKKTAIEIGWTH